MKNPVIILVMVGVMLFASSCSSGPKPINYGADACDFCRMTIVDKQHSAQIVIKTGKAFKYDAIECMLNDMKEWEHPEIRHYLVADYANPGVLTDASTAAYLISQDIPSPMGEFLTAFENEDKRNETVQDVSGTGLDWKALKAEFEID
ncbi:nitrous oxide reductase accessory protein NosL [Ekhidna sp.]|uniref:nitrous oxide reductase accessory protein NosL n=1 Tax=Ekhidna sp. TaxID=2608089 RepID=UPI003C7E348F